MSLYGTSGSYEEQANAKVWVSHDPASRLDLKPLLECRMQPPAAGEASAMHEALVQDFFTGTSQVHPVARLPKEFIGLRNGHSGSHQFLVDDFVKAVATGTRPPNHVWAAARYSLPGIIAHESAKREGAVLPVPDFGWPEGESAIINKMTPEEQSNSCR
jgi:hypothetical protein